MSDASLEGVSVLITRPERQAAELADAIAARGGESVLFPCLEIRPRPRAEVEREADALPDADITIFISRNAVDFGSRFASGQVAAIGPTTAEALRQNDVPVDIVPEGGYDSERLLAHPALAAVDGRRVRIVRGSEGRELLADTLRERGAAVDYLSAYERRLPTYSAGELDRLARRVNGGEIDCVVVMSVATLGNLLRLAPKNCARRLAGIRLVSAAPRVLKEAIERHPGRPATLAAGPELDDILDAIAAPTPTAPD